VVAGALGQVTSASAWGVLFFRYDTSMTARSAAAGSTV
jgi:hypothetical protein